MTTAIQCPAFKPTLKIGNKGQDVKEMQIRLNQRLASIYTPALQITVDGDFGSGTENAVKFLQCLAYLSVNGVMDASTWTFICDGAASLPVLRINSTGNIVKSVQVSMKNCGFYTGAIDGIFSARTEKAVKDFQAHYSLVADGIIGAKTWAALIKLDSHVENCYCQNYGGC